jgi:hypothetical protein
MKITGPDSASKTAGTKKTERSKGASGTSFSELLSADEAEAPAHTTAAGAIARVDVLLAAQTTDDPAERAARGRMKKRADTILRTLDKIRVGMLTGTLSVGNMIDIADVVASHREKINDPQLAGILDEIDLRAQIEVAKMRMALDASKVF